MPKDFILGCGGQGCCLHLCIRCLACARLHTCLRQHAPCGLSCALRFRLYALHLRVLCRHRLHRRLTLHLLPARLHGLPLRKLRGLTLRKRCGLPCALHLLPALRTVFSWALLRAALYACAGSDRDDRQFKQNARLCGPTCLVDRPRKQQNSIADLVHRDVAALFLNARQVLRRHIEHVLRIADKFSDHQVAVMRHPVLHQAAHVLAVCQRLI